MSVLDPLMLNKMILAASSLSSSTRVDKIKAFFNPLLNWLKNKA